MARARKQVEPEASEGMPPELPAIKLAGKDVVVYRSATARITSKGQITIPKLVRESMAFKTGDVIEFLDTASGLLIRRKVDKSKWDRWVGFLKNPEGKSVDEIVAEMRDP
jgi:AbrB family looped-hinge helix DNA binding protein